MTDYVNDDFQGTLGGTPSAADLGFDAKTGTLTYVAGGWDGATTQVQFGTDATATRTVSIANRVTVKGSFNIPALPTGTCRIMMFRNAAAAQVATVRMLASGQIEVTSGGSDLEDTVATGSTFIDRQIAYTFHVNQPNREAVLRLHDTVTGERWPAIRCTIGQQAIASFQIGALTSGQGLQPKFSRMLVTTDQHLLPVPDVPNIVMVINDDAPASMYTIHMSKVVEYAESGVTFINHLEASPLCAPSRANMMSGMHPQNCGVMRNGGATDDFLAVAGNERNSIYAIASDLGYRVGAFGKSLHGFDPAGNTGKDPLWMWQGVDWGFVPEDPYQQFSYTATQRRDGVGVLVDTTGETDDTFYLTDAINGQALAFIADHYTRFPDVPFFLILTPTAGHNNVGEPDPEDPGGPSWPPAPRDRPTYSGSAGRPAQWGAPEFPLTGDLGDNPPDGITYRWLDQLGNFNTHPTDSDGNEPGWHNSAPLSGGVLTNLEETFNDAVRQMQSVNDMLIDIEADLDTRGVWDDTAVMVWSDNGYHHGQHGIPGGKGSAYDADCRLDMVVRPPGGLVTPIESTAIIQPIDMLNTVREIAGYDNDITRDGRSWWGFVNGDPPTPWRSLALMGYISGDVTDWADAAGTGEPPHWWALRSSGSLFIDYMREDDDLSTPALEGEPPSDRAEFYDLVTDPAMLDNLWPDMTAEVRAVWQATIAGYYAAEGEESWEAGLGGVVESDVSDAIRAEVRDGWLATLIGERGEVADNVYRRADSLAYVLATVWAEPERRLTSGTNLKIILEDVAGVETDIELPASPVGERDQVTVITSDDTVEVPAGTWNVVVEVNRSASVKPKLDAGQIVSY